ncbi:MAG TPA: hypothetical protein PK668_01640 [Myxococcota bacterium]|nr:hypothetical protein [Myxococcota bacterium]HRY94730.1 hypothetical protein [Myxococcota bacterium]HSA20047.1 hypothetical protein [Myxococcota bacterium]
MAARRDAWTRRRTLVGILWLGWLAGCSGGGGGADCPDAGADAGIELRTCGSTGPVGAGLLGPEHLAYRGAFRLPALAAAAPLNFAWGGKAMAYFGEGDPAGSDAYRGSLFVAGNDAEDGWSELRACLVAEVSIPEPSSARDPAALPVAGLLQGLTDLRGAALYGADIYFELPKHGLQVLRQQGVDQLVMAFGQHIEDEQAPASCAGTSDPACVAPLAARPLGPQGQLDAAATLGPWWVSGASLYSLNDYLFEIPADWAGQHAGGRRLAAGRFRDGGQGSQGPVLVAVDPWLGGAAPAPGGELAGLPLLVYASVGQAGGRLAGYQHPDEWAGGAWLTAGARAAVVFVGAKAVGPQSWYGWQRCPCGQVPCAEREEIGGPGCFEADGARCALPDDHYCACGDSGCDPACFGERGWWSQGWEAQALFYDPAELARVAAGELGPDQPQPYACLSLADRLFLVSLPGTETGQGSPPMRRYQLGAVAYDRARNLLYVSEQLADPDSQGPVVHVWQVQE